MTTKLITVIFTKFGMKTGTVQDTENTRRVQFPSASAFLTRTGSTRSRRRGPGGGSSISGAGGRRSRRSRRSRRRAGPGGGRAYDLRVFIMTSSLLQ